MSEMVVLLAGSQISAGLLKLFWLLGHRKEPSGYWVLGHLPHQVPSSPITEADQMTRSRKSLGGSKPLSFHNDHGTFKA